MSGQLQTRRSHTGVNLALLCVSVGGVALCYYCMFRAGCTGDVKSGALGNPARALEWESLATLPFLLGVVAGVALMARTLRGVSGWSKAAIAACALVGTVSLWLGSVEMESRGILSCFASARALSCRSADLSGAGCRPEAVAFAITVMSHPATPPWADLGRARR